MPTMFKGTDYGICSIIKPQLAFDDNLTEVPYWEKLFGTHNWAIEKARRVDCKSTFFFCE